MNSQKILPYVLQQLQNLTAIDSPTGFTEKAAAYLMEELARLGYTPALTRKGGVTVDLGGEGNGILLCAHVDTLGAVVCSIKENGRLQLSPVGGLQPHNTEAENCKIFTRFDGVYTGTFQLENASVHVNKEYGTLPRSFETMEVVLDEEVSSAEETRRLGIEVGDFVCFDPRTVITQSGYIKSRFLDDKLSAAILLGYANLLKEAARTPARHVALHFTVYEEVGHGGAASVPADITDVLGVDMGCVGAGLTCTEREVSICAKDSRGPSNYALTTELIKTAKENGLDYAVDVYPFYGSDVDVALAAGYDVRHALIGAGVYASHGYERSHIKGVENTLGLINAFIPTL